MAILESFFSRTVVGTWVSTGGDSLVPNAMIELISTANKIEKNMAISILYNKDNTKDGTMQYKVPFFLRLLA